ncbi:MAG: cellulase family glycosylhydrolase [Bacteroidota bacterium]
MNFFKSFSIILVFLMLGLRANSQGFLKTSGKQIVNEKGENIILRGYGLGGWMLQEGYMLGIKNTGQQHEIRKRIEKILSKEQADEFYEVWLENHTTKADIDSLKAWGFNSVRLPMHYNLYTLPAELEPVAGNNTWIEKGFALTDSLLAWCKANNMYLILDLHAAPGGQGNDLNISDRDSSKPSLWQSEANQQKTIALWRKLAERYVNESYIGGYDLVNEPNWGFTDSINDRNGIKEQNNAALKKLYISITNAIREVDKNHLLIIEGNGWGNNYKGIVDEGLWDSNMVLSFHKYWNFNDEKSIEHMINHRNKLNVPVWLGETGENSNVWFTQAVALLESNNIGWAWWPLKKLGANNPLQVKSNLNYDRLLKYWNGEADEPPKESDVYSGLLELATYTNIATNIKHYDVIDALIRQPFTIQTKPFKTVHLRPDLIIPAPNYDLGKNGMAYYDSDTADYRSAGKPGVGNRGRVYRSDGVDIFKDSSLYDSYYVGDIKEDEWLQYTIEVEEPGKYSLVFFVSAIKAGGLFTVTKNGKQLSPQLKVPATGGYTNWQTITIPVQFEKGSNKFRLYFDNGGFNLKSFSLNKN